jgi:predicted regulator of Ras-like GTPase activity (Roadblock/LC7/MglB family)
MESLLASRPMDAAQAIADLMEISSQVRAAVVAAADGTVEAASPGGDAGAALASAAVELLERGGSARASGDSPVTQLEVAAREGSVFVVRDGDRIVAATTGASPTVGLVFYDLKTCLRSLDARPAEPS